jgi:rod shape-determining protein MreC
MESFFSRYRNALVLIVVLVAQLLALAIQVKRPKADDRSTVSLMRYTMVSVVTPPERMLHDTGLWFRSVWNGYVDLIHVRRENAALKEQIQRLRLEQAGIAQDAAQGLRLQKMLGFKERYINTTLPAQVIGTGGTDQSKVLYIDKGWKDGLRQDMPVITADGIVGKLKDVFPHTSQVLLATDPTSGLGVVLQDTRVRGVLRGRAYGQLEIADISPDSRIKAGESVVTSGGDQIFPRGLPVGTVERVIPDPDHDPLVDVLIRPAAKLSQLEEVLVITKMSDTASAQQAKDLAESEAEGEAEQKRASDILAERLPSRVDPNSPADTNPEKLVDADGKPLKPPPPPVPNHPDRFSPGAEPDAAQMTPGHRWAPVKYGIEVKAAPAPKPPVAKQTSSAISNPEGTGATSKTLQSGAAHVEPAQRAASGSTVASAPAAPVSGAAKVRQPKRIISDGPAAASQTEKSPAAAKPRANPDTAAPPAKPTQGGPR